MKDFVIKDAAADVPCRFRIGRHDDGRIKLVFEERTAQPPHIWRHVAAAVLEDDDLFGYLDAAGVRI